MILWDDDRGFGDLSRSFSPVQGISSLSLNSCKVEGAMAGIRSQPIQEPCWKVVIDSDSFLPASFPFLTARLQSLGGSFFQNETDAASPGFLDLSELLLMIARCM